MLAKTKELKIVKRIFLDRLGGLILILLNSSDKIFQCDEFQWGMFGKRKHGDFGEAVLVRFCFYLYWRMGQSFLIGKDTNYL